ncbi:zf-C2HC5-domain-containing protein [Aspergillus ruber CBS 135680]|uniref:Zf-C2HC5-domain-containing protein n=1 Tax=Aspergillus ruber (strain CBS 135680) TaxID=1388766 RepID=A0A017S8N8_ASPRC|nr:zf-C2HC5-domain-containing protein [Aspergillus ruber CBS 135680]EYE93156.1 zf-C2HC5-domain-containing protein [Aspergillus ruber CBS 135680]
MSAANLVSWGTPRLAQLLPLDGESLGEIITYSATLSKEECAEHLKNLLGDSPGAFEFIASFNSRREAQQPSVPRSGESTSPAGNRNDYERGGATKRGGKKGRAPLHSTGPPRRPENYGNVTGGYRKADQEDDYMSMGRSRNNNAGGDAASSLSAEPAASLRPSPRESAASSRNPSPVPKNKAPPSASGPVISELLPNVKSKSAKPSRQGGSATAGSFKNSLTTSDISDLTAAIAALEVSTNPSLSTERRKCTCYASIHPLFDPAPNCLNCGKIICSLEGLQPCSFCGTPLLSNDEVQSIIKELRAERGQEKMRVHNEGVQREGGSGPAPGPGGSSGQLDAAKAHRDRLLNFQAQNARRTRVVDEAADFETPNLASTIWMSPAQRALALKKQQRVLREMEEKARPEWEKKKTIMSLDIKGGRVRKVYHEAPADSGPSKEEEEEAKAEEILAASDGQQRTRQDEAFSHNPLLAAGGLLRPVWKNSSGDKPEARKEKKPQTWRRVQDDKDDNEQWILDGGLHGHTTDISPVHCQSPYG